MKNKKLILIPASAAERIYPLRPENRLLSAVGQFEPKRLNCWYPVQSYFLTTQSIDEANAVFHRLCKPRPCGGSARPTRKRSSMTSGARHTTLCISARSTTTGCAV